uniref:Alternative protein OPN3 n=1 Tax=Homo sapiens TaxID=9606 RepID=L8E9L4_HUMAN|nr:alternative protein OPN3 [Homo sapiens]
MEQVHPGRTRTRLHCGLEIQGCQRFLLCAFLISWLPGGAPGCHSPLLWPYSIFHSNASLCGRSSDNSSDQDFKI